MIRDFKINDQEHVFNVALNSWKEAYKNVFSAEKIHELITQWYSKKSSEEILDMVNVGTAIFKVIENERQEIAGFITSTTNENHAELRRIYLTPEAWGKGYGKQLLVEAENYFRSKGFKNYIAKVHQDNEIGLKFYEKDEFRISGKIGDELILEKKI